MYEIRNKGVQIDMWCESVSNEAGNKGRSKRKRDNDSGVRKGGRS